MGFLRRNGTYDRTRILAKATRAVRARRHKKALALYQQVLEHEPNNPDLHRRVAPLLARAGKLQESWFSYRRAAEGLTRQGFLEQAIGVFRDACNRLPRNSDAWFAVADLEVERGRPRDAVEALQQGRRRFRSRRDRTEAIRLLRRAHQIDSGDFGVTFDLAGVMAGSGMRGQALKLLDDLALSCTRRQLRRVRRRQFAISPSPRHAWRWLRALAGVDRPQGTRRVAA